MGIQPALPLHKPNCGVRFMFLGNYSYTLDNKGRLTIPARFREGLPPDIVVTRGFDRCLTVYPINVWKTLSEQVTSMSITNPKGRMLRRALFADAVNTQLDGQGRVLIPDRLREYAGLDLSSEVVVVGLDKMIELWNPERWQTQNDDQMETLEGDPGIWESLRI